MNKLIFWSVFPLHKKITLSSPPSCCSSLLRLLSSLPLFSSFFPCNQNHLPSSALFHPSTASFFPILYSFNILDFRQRLSTVLLPLILSPIIKNTPPSNAMLLLLLSLSILVQPPVSSQPSPLSSTLQQLSPKIPLAILTSLLTERSKFHQFNDLKLHISISL